MKKPRYRLEVVVTAEQNVFKKIPCSIYIGDKLTDKPKVVLEPTKETFKAIQKNYEVSIAGTSNGFDGKPELSINIPQAYIADSGLKYWSDTLANAHINLFVETMDVIQHLKGTTADSGSTNNVTFRLSDNKYLSPNTIQSTSYTGDVNIERLKAINVVDKNNNNYSFDVHYKSETTDSLFKQWKYLVCEVKTNFSANNTKDIDKHYGCTIDDICTLASFISRTRTVCLGWEAYDNTMQLKHFYLNRTIATRKCDEGIDSGVIGIYKADGFFQSALTSLENSSYKRCICEAIESITPFEPRTIEYDFLSYFSSLEKIILKYRDENNLQFTLNKNDWSILQKEIRAAIKKAQIPALGKVERANYYANLSGINRIPFRKAYEEFISTNNIVTSDLWPVYDSQGVGLVDFRNMLAHGVHIPERALDPMIVACSHLRWLLERIILALLQWPLNNSEICVEVLASRHVDMRDLEFLRDQAKKAITK